MQQGKSGSSAKDEFNSPLFAVADTPTASQLEIVLRGGAYQTIEQGMGKLYAAMTFIEGEDTAPHHALYVLLALAEQEGKFSAVRLQELTDDKNKQLIELTAQLLGQSTIKKMLNQILAMVWHPRASTARATPHAIPFPSPPPIPPKPPLTPPPRHALTLPPARPPAPQGRKHVYKTTKELIIDTYFDGIPMDDMNKVQKQHDDLFDPLTLQDEDAKFPISAAFFDEIEDSDGNPKPSFPSEKLLEVTKQLALRYEVYEGQGDEDDTATQAPLCNAIAFSFVMLVGVRGSRTRTRTREPSLPYSPRPCHPCLAAPLPDASRPQAPGAPPALLRPQPGHPRTQKGPQLDVQRGLLPVGGPGDADLPASTSVREGGRPAAAAARQEGAQEAQVHAAGQRLRCIFVRSSDDHSDDHSDNR